MWTRALTQYTTSHPPVQVSSMQQQVSALQLSREAQDRELARLRQEALQLAHSAAAAQAASEGNQQAGGGLREQADAAQAALSDQAMTIQQLQR